MAVTSPTPSTPQRLPSPCHPIYHNPHVTPVDAHHPAAATATRSTFINTTTTPSPPPPSPATDRNCQKERLVGCLTANGSVWDNSKAINTSFVLLVYTYCCQGRVYATSICSTKAKISTARLLINVTNNSIDKEKVLEEPDNTKIEVKQEGDEENIRKRPVPDEEGEIDYEFLDKRFLIINWESKFYHIDRHGVEYIYYKIFRSDGISRWIKTFFEMVNRFDRMDLEELYNLVMKGFETNSPEGVDLVLWGDLRTVFKETVNDDLWKNEKEWILKKKRYPLTKETLKRMLAFILIAECEVDLDLSRLTITLNRLERSIHIKESTSGTRASRDTLTNENTTNPQQVPPTPQASHTLSTIKLIILKKGEYDIWAMKMEHYLEHTDYPIWKVIQKGNGPVQVSTYTNGQIRVLPPKTAEEIFAREIERKARTTLLMAIPEDHLAKFHKMTNAKEMWKAIKSRFGGNDKSKKMSLTSSWSQVSLIMRTKPGADTLNFDDLYNNLRVFKYDVKGSTGSSSSTQNVAFVSSNNSSSTNKVNTAYGVSTFSGHNSQKEGSSSYTDDLMYSFFDNQSSGPQLDHDDLKHVDEFDLEKMDLKWQVAKISTRLKKFYKKTGRKLHFDAKDPVGFDKRKVECFNCHNTCYFARE
nr:hypothetical protein [Tanacetum cinerariifolium]